MELRLSLIHSPNYPDTINVDEDLQDYFSEPRRVKLHDQIIIRPLLQAGKKPRVNDRADVSRAELEVLFVVSSFTGDDVLVSGDNCRIIVDSKKVQQGKSKTR